MKKNLSIIVLVLMSLCAFAQQKEKDLELEEQAAAIRKELSLDNKVEHLVYNVLYHVKTRIADIPLGHGNYQKLISYVNEERISMMKSLLPADKYKRYETVFGPGEKQKITTFLAKNAEYIKINGVRANEASIDADDKFVKEEEEESSDAVEGNTPKK
jgi:hypothetical protein